MTASTNAPRPRRAATLGLVLALVAVAAVVGVVVWRVDAGPPLDPAAAPRTAFSDLTPATGPPTLPSLETAAPRKGTVVPAAGPFDDRFRLRNLAYDGVAVTGAAEITSDVSELLELEVLAGFYDGDGRLIGTGRYVHHADHGAGHEEEGPPEQVHAFRIEVPANLRRTAVAAAVGVPVLVNE